ncbi:MAG: cation transporting ATPase C-terminal domain-containing protein [Deltaproteobacteria bacterium]
MACFQHADRDSGLFINEVSTNPSIWFALAVGAALLFMAIYLPGLSKVLHVQTPDRQGWLLILGAAIIPLLVGQAAKIGANLKG